MTQPDLAVAVADTTIENNKVRWRWFALGCLCLVIGSFYLSAVELETAKGFDEDRVDAVSVVDAARTSSR